jgi:Family of unknown function (DUF6210)
MSYVFLNPDGAEDFGLQVIVEHPTGVVYAHQCAGYLTELMAVEGFLIPIGGPDAARRIYGWFWQAFEGTGYAPDGWTKERIDQLASLVAEIPCWLTHADGKRDERRFLELDRGRIGECVEAWIPVATPYGPGILVVENSD